MTLNIGLFQTEEHQAVDRDPEVTNLKEKNPMP